MNIIKFKRTYDYIDEYTRVNRNKKYTYKYYFKFHHYEDLKIKHIKNSDGIPEAIWPRNGKRAVFYEDVSKRERIPNDEVQK